MGKEVSIINLFRAVPKAQTEKLNTPSTYQREGEEGKSYEIKQAKEPY